MKNPFKNIFKKSVPKQEDNLCSCGKLGYSAETFTLADDIPEPKKTILCMGCIRDKCNEGYFVVL